MMNKKLLSICVALFFASNSFAQNLFISSGTTLHSEDKQIISVHDTFVNEGIVDLSDSAFLYMYGDVLENDTFRGTGILVMEGETQTLIGGTFSNIRNSNDSSIIGGSITVVDSVIFSTGHFILGANSVVLEADCIIKHFNENNYFVTNGTGVLTRKNVGATKKVFPVGVATGDYTPAAIENDGDVDNFSVRVFEEVFADGMSGDNVSDLGVGRTWDVSEDTAGGSDVTLYLQYNNVSAGASFDPTDGYVSHYIGTAPNTSGDTTSNTKWDLLIKANRGSGNTGNLTYDNSTISNTTVFSRSGFTTFSPFSVASYNNASPLPVDLISWNAQWDHNNAADARLTWTTATEVNSHYFEIERSFDFVNFEPLATIYSMSENGASNTLLDYVYFDVNVKSITKNTVYYRLTQYDYDGTNSTFDIKNLRVNSNDIAIVKVYPNPANDVLTYEVNGDIKGKEVSIKLINSLGVEVYNYTTLSMENNHFGAIDLNNLPAGIYITKIGYGLDSQTKIIVLNK